MRLAPVRTRSGTIPDFALTLGDLTRLIPYICQKGRRRLSADGTLSNPEKPVTCRREARSSMVSHQNPRSRHRLGSAMPCPSKT
jgi:hypothetical protein